MRNAARIRSSCGTFFLEGSLSLEVGIDKPALGAVVCHPHPLYGGTMDNPVVLGVAHALAARGFAVLRFNFRGVGASGGTHGGGEAEVEDVVAALDFLEARSDVDGARLAVAGYSFGAVVGLEVGCTDPRVGALALVAPPLAAFPMPKARTCPIPKLAVAGTRDTYCPEALLEPWFAAAAEPKSRAVIAGADHFFAGREEGVGAAVAAFLAERLGTGTSPL